MIGTQAAPSPIEYRASNASALRIVQEARP